MNHLRFTSTSNSTSTPPPFGSVMPGRSYLNGAYRFGFNGKENDKVPLESYCFEYRVYNANLGSFSSMDLWVYRYPSQSCYIFGHNSPIQNIDWLGLGDKPNDKVKSFGFITRKWNSITGQNFKNIANEYAVKIGAKNKDVNYNLKNSATGQKYAAVNEATKSNNKRGNQQQKSKETSTEQDPELIQEVAITKKLFWSGGEKEPLNLAKLANELEESVEPTWESGATTQVELNYSVGDVGFNYLGVGLNYNLGTIQYGTSSVSDKTVGGGFGIGLFSHSRTVNYNNQPKRPFTYNLNSNFKFITNHESFFFLIHRIHKEFDDGRVELTWGLGYEVSGGVLIGGVNSSGILGYTWRRK